MRLGFLKWLRCFIVHCLLVLCVSLARPALSQEKEYPAKPIEILIGYPPGGPVDVATRILTEELTKELKVPFQIQYKTGAGGGIAVSSLIHAKPDGYALLSTSNGSVTNLPAMERKPSFNPVKDLTPIAFYADSPLVMTSNGSSQWTSFDAVVLFARQNPGKLNAATSGVGSMGQFLLEYLKGRGVDITHVPTKGGPPTLTNILGGHVDLALGIYTQVAPYIKSGQLRLVATTSKIDQNPSVPTFERKGFPEANAFGIWSGIFAPANLPKKIQDRLAAAFEKALRSPSAVEGLQKVGFIPEFKGPEAFRKQIGAEYETMKEIAQKAGLVK